MCLVFDWPVEEQLFPIFQPDPKIVAAAAVAAGGDAAFQPSHFD